MRINLSGLLFVIVVPIAVGLITGSVVAAGWTLAGWFAFSVLLSFVGRGE